MIAVSRLRARRAVAASLLAPSLLVWSTGCRELLRPDSPQLISEDALQRPANASLMVAGAVGDFECAFANYIVTMGALADEFADSQLSVAGANIDRRTVTPDTPLYAQAPCTTFGGVYTPLSTARAQADNALRLLDGWTDQEVEARQANVARMAAYAGYALVLLGEGFCSAAVDGGPELTPAQVFALAEQRFTRAIQVATGVGGAAGDSLRRLAHVGRARVRLDQGRVAEAAADAAQVPAGFVFNARYAAAPARVENRVFRFNNSGGGVTVDPSYRRLTVGGVVDPRVPVTDAGRGGSLPTVRLWVQNKYPSLASPIPIATWREALLIRAEAALTAGDIAAAIALLNDLRRQRALPTIATPATTADARALLLEERRRELFLESHRLFDTIRFAVPLTPPPGTPFPNSGGTYGDTKCLPLPDVERLNNPNIGPP